MGANGHRSCAEATPAVYLNRPSEFHNAFFREPERADNKVNPEGKNQTLGACWLGDRFGLFLDHCVWRPTSGLGPGADWQLSVVRPEEVIDQRVWVE
jgi:hypothetical protein